MLQNIESGWRERILLLVVDPSPDDVPHVLDWRQIRRACRPRKDFDAVPLKGLLGECSRMWPCVVLLKDLRNGAFLQVRYDNWQKDFFDISLSSESPVDANPMRFAGPRNTTSHQHTATSVSIMLHDANIVEAFVWLTTNSNSSIVEVHTKSAFVAEEHFLPFVIPL